MDIDEARRVVAETAAELAMKIDPDDSPDLTAHKREAASVIKTCAEAVQLVGFGPQGGDGRTVTDTTTTSVYRTERGETGFGS